MNDQRSRSQPKPIEVGEDVIDPSASTTVPTPLPILLPTPTHTHARTAPSHSSVSTAYASGAAWVMAAAPIPSGLVGGMVVLACLDGFPVARLCECGCA